MSRQSFWCTELTLKNNITSILLKKNALNQDKISMFNYLHNRDPKEEKKLQMGLKSQKMKKCPINLRVEVSVTHGEEGLTTLTNLTRHWKRIVALSLA